MKLKSITIILLIMVNISSKAQNISEEFPFDSKYQINGNDSIHFIDVGSGDPILFLHGIPMSSYSWRNVIPILSDSSRCIALDLIGYGKSSKPAIEYSFKNQYDYLVSFIESLELNNITLVMTDIGGILGSRYAKEYPGKIKAMVFMEAPLADAVTFHKNGGMMQHMLFWMSAKDKMAHRMFVKKNMFIKMMPMLIKRKLSKVEKATYLKPFETEESRIALFTMPNSFPKKGKNATTDDMADFMNKNNDFLTKTEIPKLLLYANPGMLTTKKTLKWAKENLPNLETMYMGKAKHLMEEDLPIEIGNAIKKWRK